MTRLRLALVAALLLLPALLGAQTPVVNPTVVEFIASTDHNVTAPDGTVMVKSYEIRFYATGATAPTSTGNLGKPTPAPTTNLCSVPLDTYLTGIPFSPTITYMARVVAISSTGLEGGSEFSNPFLRVAAAPPPARPTGVTLVRR